MSDVSPVSVDGDELFPPILTLTTSLTLSINRSWNVLYSISTDCVSPKLKSATSTICLFRFCIKYATANTTKITATKLNETGTTITDNCDFDVAGNYK